MSIILLPLWFGFPSWTVFSSCQPGALGALSHFSCWFLQIDYLFQTLTFIRNVHHKYIWSQPVLYIAAYFVCSLQTDVLNLKYTQSYKNLFLFLFKIASRDFFFLYFIYYGLQNGVNQNIHLLFYLSLQVSSHEKPKGRNIGHIGVTKWQKFMKKSKGSARWLILIQSDAFGEIHEWKENHRMSCGVMWQWPHDRIA